jgi:ATP-dependent Clp protease ATP-binding subunit ClpA
VIQQMVQNPLALELLDGQFHEGEIVLVDRQGDGLRITPAPVAERIGA